MTSMAGVQGENLHIELAKTMKIIQATLSREDFSRYPLPRTLHGNKSKAIPNVINTSLDFLEYKVKKIQYDLSSCCFLYSAIY